MGKKTRKKKGSLLGAAWGIIKSILVIAFNILRWMAQRLWDLATWSLRLAKKARKAGKEAEIERNRPSAEALCAPLDSLEGSEEGLEGFESSLYSGKSLIGLILGSRGSGKSALGLRILENIVAKTGRKAYCMGFERKDLPEWIEPITSLDQVHNNSSLLVDEGGVEFSSRSAMSSANKLLSALLLISRHKDINVIFISQNSANIEVNAIRQSDYLLLKRPSLLQLDFERKAIRDIYEKVKDGFREHKSKGALYVYSDQYQGFASNSMPSFWSEELSKSYRNR